MAPTSTHDPVLPPEVLSALGVELGTLYQAWADHLPPNLVALAARVIVNVDLDRPQKRSLSAIFDPNLYDLQAIQILDEAFGRAWADLQSVNHTASKEDVAKCLRLLMRSESNRDPKKLATRAVIKIILPAESPHSSLSALKA